MATYRITILELKPAVPSEPTIPPTAFLETKVFEQVVENLNLGTLIRQINATPRRRRKTALSLGQ